MRAELADPFADKPFDDLVPALTDTRDAEGSGGGLLFSTLDFSLVLPPGFREVEPPKRATTLGTTPTTLGNVSRSVFISDCCAISNRAGGAATQHGALA